MSGKWDRHDWAAVALLVAVVLAFYWPLITPEADQRRSFPAGDFYDQFHAFASYKHDRLWAGEIPLWNPYTFGGHPFLADVQAAVFYPIGLLTILLSGRGSFSPWWMAQRTSSVASRHWTSTFWPSPVVHARRLTASSSAPPAGNCQLAAYAWPLPSV